MTKKRIVKLVFLSIALFVLIEFLNLIWKIPLKSKNTSSATELRTEYFKGLLGGLYIRRFRECSSWFFPFSTCDSPDPFPFLRDRLVKGADPDSFVFVGSISKPPDWNSASDIYKDKNYVIIYDEIIPDSDPQSLQVLDGYAKDKKNVYAGSVFRHLDTSTFELLGCNFFRDASNIYNIFYEGGNKPLSFIDKNSFEMIDRKGKACNLVPYVAKDKNWFYGSDATGVTKMPNSN